MLKNPFFYVKLKFLNNNFLNMEHRRNSRALVEQRNTDEIPEHLQSTGTLAEQSEYHEVSEQENTSGTRERLQLAEQL